MITAHKHYLIIIASLFIVYSLCVCIINFVIDPYGEFDFSHSRKFENFNLTYPFKAIKILEKKDYVLVFGTSHSATLSKECLEDDVLNLSLSVYGYPEDIYDFLTKLNVNQLRHIKKMYVLVDYFIADKKPLYTGMDFSSRTQKYWQTIRNIGPLKVMAALGNIYKNRSGQFSQYIAPTGECVYVKEKEFTAVQYTAGDGFHYPGNQKKYYHAIEEFSRGHGIECVFFKTILSKYFLQHMDFQSIVRHFSEILGEIQGLYSLMYLQDCSDSLAYFRDPTHHSFRLTRIEGNILTSSDKRAQYWVTSQNLDFYLQNLRIALLKK